MVPCSRSAPTPATSPSPASAASGSAQRVGGGSSGGCNSTGENLSGRRAWLTFRAVAAPQSGGAAPLPKLMDHVAPPPFRARAARLIGTVVAVVALASALPTASAHAQTAPDPVAAADAAVADLRAQADALADHYFETLG